MCRSAPHCVCLTLGVSLPVAWLPSVSRQTLSDVALDCRHPITLAIIINKTPVMTDQVATKKIADIHEPHFRRRELSLRPSRREGRPSSTQCDAVEFKVNRCGVVETL